MSEPRLALLVSNHETVRRLLPALRESRFALTQHCLDGDQLLRAVNAKLVDVALVSTGPRALERAAILTLAARLPSVVLDSEPDAAHWNALQGSVLLPESSAADVLEALDATIRGQHHTRRRIHETKARRANNPEQPSQSNANTSRVFAVVSGYGAPGRTTVALNLAATLGMAAPTVLVDLDLGGALLAGLLEANTARHIGTLAKSNEPKLPVSRDIQRLHTSCAKGWLLAGLPRPDARNLIDTAFVERLLTELKARFSYVVCDTGTQWMDGDSLASAALTLANTLLLVATADDPGIWRARQAAEQMRAWWPDHQLGLVVNQHRRRIDASRAEIEYSLGDALAALLPQDTDGCARALASHKPVVYDARSRLGRSIVSFGKRLYGGAITMPTETIPKPGRPWLRWLSVGGRT